MGRKFNPARIVVDAFRGLFGKLLGFKEYKYWGYQRLSQREKKLLGKNVGDWFGG